MQQIFSILTLLPGYLVFFALFLVILPTILAVLLRFFLYIHLSQMAAKTRKMLGGIKLEFPPKIITKLEYRFRDSKNLEKINTAAIIEGTYSLEKFSFLGMPLSCELAENVGRALPNLLLSFGLLGTFLGITFNLSNLSQTITQVDINDVRNLVEELDAPLQGMGIAFTTSLIAIACSAFLTVINLTWNTNLAKSKLLSTIEDYIDNIYLPQIQPVSPTEAAIERFSQDFNDMVQQLGATIEESINKAFTKINDSADTFKQAANALDNSRFPEKLATATNNLAIAQNQFSQSSLVLQKSTQSFEHSLDSMQKLTQKFLELNQQVANINQKYNYLVSLNLEKNIIEKASLQEIQQELNKLVHKINNPENINQ